jgi:hypothetical protein
MRSATELQKEIQKTRQHLNKLETQLHRMKYRKLAGTENEEQRIRRVEAEFKRKYPNIDISRNLLRLVGTEPYNPRWKDKEVTRQIIAERYG